MPSELKSRTDATPAQAVKTAEEIAEYKVKIAQVLSQGVVGHALSQFDHDPSRRYIYSRERPADISRFTSLGYRVETDVGEGMHGTGDGKRRVGDVILMSIARQDYEIIEEVKADRNKKKMSSPIEEYKKRAAEAAARNQAAPPIDLMEKKE